MYENLWGWTGMGTPKNQWKKEILPVVCRQCQETKRTLKKSEDWSE